MDDFTPSAHLHFFRIWKILQLAQLSCKCGYICLISILRTSSSLKEGIDMNFTAGQQSVQVLALLGCCCSSVSRDKWWVGTGGEVGWGLGVHLVFLPAAPPHCVKQCVCWWRGGWRNVEGRDGGMTAECKEEEWKKRRSIQLVPINQKLQVEMCEHETASHELAYYQSVLLLRSGRWALPEEKLCFYALSLHLSDRQDERWE